MNTRRTAFSTLAAALTVVAALALSLGGIPPSQAVPPAPAPTTFILGPVIAGGPLPVAGSSVAASGVLTSNGAGVAGVPVNLLVKRYGATSFSPAAHGVTDSTGAITLTVQLFKNATISLQYPGSPEFASSTTTPWTALISTRVFVTLSDTTPRIGQRVVFRGRTNPAKPGHTISLWSGYTSRGADVAYTHAPVRLASVKVRADGTYVLPFRFAHTGRKHLFLQVSRGDGNTTGWSRELNPYVS